MKLYQKIILLCIALLIGGGVWWWQYVHTTDKRFFTVGDAIYTITWDLPYYRFLADDVDTDNLHDFYMTYITDGENIYDYDCPGQAASGFDAGSFSYIITSTGYSISDKNGNYKSDNKNGIYGWMNPDECIDGYASRFSKIKE